MHKGVKQRLPAIQQRVYLDGGQQQDGQLPQLGNGLPTAPVVAYQEVKPAPWAYERRQKGHDLHGNAEQNHSLSIHMPPG